MRLNKNDHEAHRLLGLVLTRQGQCDQAIASFEECVWLEKDAVAPLNNLASALHGKGQGHQDNARKWYDQAVAWMEEHTPKDPELRRFRAEAEELMGMKGVPK